MFKKKQLQHIKNAPKAENFQTEPTEKKKDKAKKKSKKKSNGLNLQLTHFLSGILDGSFLTRGWVIRMLPFIMFIVFLTMIYIANQYSALRRVKEIEVISNELKDLRNEHISTKSELMYQKKISEVAKKLQDDGIKETNTPPFKIYVKTDKK